MEIMHWEKKQSIVIKKAIYQFAQTHNTSY